MEELEFLASAQEDPNPDVRLKAAWALGQVWDFPLHRILEPLTRSLQDSSADVRKQAAVSLSRALKKIETAALVGPVEHHKDNEEALQRLATPANAGLLGAVLRDERFETGSPEGYLALEALSHYLGQYAGAAGRGELIRSLAAADREARRFAIRCLSEQKDPRAVDSLARLLHNDPELRSEAASCLGQIDDRRAIEALIAALASPSIRVRECAASVLARKRAPEAGAPLRKFLREFIAPELEQCRRPPPPTAPAAISTEHRCDICSSPNFFPSLNSGCLFIPYPLFRRVVSFGYDPYASGRRLPEQSIMLKERRSGANVFSMEDRTRRQAYEHWVDSIGRHHEWDWVICAECAADLEEFLGCGISAQ